MSTKNYRKRGKCVKCDKPGPLYVPGAMTVQILRRIFKGAFIPSDTVSSTFRLCEVCGPVVADALEEIGLVVK